MLAMHGVTGHGLRFRRLAEEGLPELRIVAPDLRGHGHSTWAPPWNAERHVDDLLETLDAEGIERTALLGHSFGGLLALRLAQRAPDRVERIALLDPAVGLPLQDALEAAENARNDDGWESYPQALEFRRSLLPEHARTVVEEDLAAALEQGGDGRVRFRFLRSAAICAWGEMAAPPPSLAAYPGELLLVPSLREDYVTDTLRKALRADLGARLHEHGLDAGHMLYWEAFDGLVALLRPFLVAGTALR